MDMVEIDFHHAHDFLKGLIASRGEKDDHLALVRVGRAASDVALIIEVLDCCSARVLLEVGFMSEVGHWDPTLMGCDDCDDARLGHIQIKLLLK